MPTQPAAPPLTAAPPEPSTPVHRATVRTLRQGDSGAASEREEGGNRRLSPLQRRIAQAELQHIVTARRGTVADFAHLIDENWTNRR